jgi:tetratricopeptide (TPR) repeat protein
MRAAMMLACTALVVVRGPAQAQLGISRSNQQVLVLWPSLLRVTPLDSVMAVQIGDQLREKLDVKERFRMRVPSRARICEILMSSGFRCPEPLDPENANRLASTMQVDAYLVGTYTHNSKPKLHVRMVDLKRTGLAGWITVQGDTNWKADQFASVAVDSIDAFLRGAEAAHDCYDRLDHNDVKGAREKANDAFKIYPNQPAAALCLQRYFEAVHAPADSMIFALEKAVRGDSVNARSWDHLATAYADKNDNQKSIDARTHQLEADPRNQALRISVARGLIEVLKQPQQGIDVLDAGLAENPTDIQALRVKQDACVNAQMWKCALSSLTSLYEADTTVRGDSVFYAKVFGAAQALNDTTAMLKWSAEAVKFVPNSLTMWRARAAALKAAGRTDSALVAYQHILQYDTADVGVTLLVAQGLINGMVIDTVTALDTAKLNRADVLLTRVATLSRDTMVRANVASLYANVGLKVAQTRKYNALSDSIMLKSLSYGLKGRATEPVNFFLGVHYFDPLQTTPGKPGIPDQIRALATHTPPRNPTPAEAAKGCELLGQELALIAKIRPAITVGMTMSAQTQGSGRSILQYLTQLESQVPTIRTIFKCK